MGHKTLYAAVMFSLLIAVSTLHAEETATTQSTEPVTEKATPPATDESGTQTLTPEALITPAPAAHTGDTPSPATKQANETTAPSTMETEAAAPAQKPAMAEQQPAITEKSTGDTLTIPKSQAAKPAPAQPKGKPMPHEDVAMPARGATMSEVEKYYGKPRRKMAPVGQPPITRWIYDHYTVYFEHQFVIESVKNQPHRAAPAKAHKPTKSQPAKSPAKTGTPPPPAKPMKPAAKMNPAPTDGMAGSADTAKPATSEPSGEMAPVPASKE